MMHLLNEPRMSKSMSRVPTLPAVVHIQSLILSAIEYMMFERLILSAIE